jgi:hypothetical protein
MLRYDIINPMVSVVGPAADDHRSKIRRNDFDIHTYRRAHQHIIPVADIVIIQPVIIIVPNSCQPDRDITVRKDMEMPSKLRMIMPTVKMVISRSADADVNTHPPISVGQLGNN